MRPLLLLLALSACATAPLKLAVTPTTFDARALAGTWHVVATNFPMWTEGAKTQPTFSYGVLGEGELSDLVRYLENGAPGLVEGIDRQSATTPTHFTWRGVGWLALFSSGWDVVAIDTAGEWAIIAFSSTLATPEGVDIITRSAAPSPELLEVPLALIASEPLLRERARGLRLLAPVPLDP
jgi:lipocalin